MNFLRQGFRKLSHDRQTDRQTRSKLYTTLLCGWSEILASWLVAAWRKGATPPTPIRPLTRFCDPMPRYFLQLTPCGKGRGGALRANGPWTMDHRIEASVSVCTRSPRDPGAGGRSLLCKLLCQMLHHFTCSATCVVAIIFVYCMAAGSKHSAVPGVGLRRFMGSVSR